MHAPQRKKKDSTKVNVAISVVFHTLIIGVLIFFAAREGVLGTKLKTIAVQMAPKEKPPEKKPEEKKPEKKIEPPKEEPKAQPKIEEPPKVVQAPRVAPANLNANVPPSVAPPPAGVGNFNFTDESAKTVQSSGDPVILYKGLVEYSLRSKWNRPTDLDDINFVAEVDLTIDPAGKITGYEWRKGSGDNRWDDSVKRVLKQTASINRPPPKNFPAKILVRFDTQQETVPVSMFGEP